MTTWNEISAAVPDLADRVTRAFAAHKHKVLATLRADGSPRVSGTELDIDDDGLWIGSMPDALKAKDLQRDPRFALHSAPMDVTMDQPDVKIAGTAHELLHDDEKQAWAAARPGAVPPGPFHLFRLDVTEVVCTWVAGDQMLIDSWHEDGGLTRATR